MFETKIFAENLRKNRIRQHLTQTQIANALFVTPQTVSKWENAQALPDIANLCALAKLLDLRVDQLLDPDHESERSKCYIGIDGGNTKTDLCLFKQDGTVVTVLTLCGTNPNTVGMETACQILQMGIDQLLNLEPNVQGVFAGIAGLSTPYNNRQITQFLKKQYPYLLIFVDTDIQNVVGCVRGVDKCTAVLCGSGSVVYGSDGEELHSFGGYGYLFDDAGSTYLIGRDVLHRCLMMEDGILQPTIMLELAEKKFGGKLLDGLDRIYARGVDFIASFAPIAFEAYAKHDKIAKTILEENFKRLTELILQARLVIDCGNTVIFSGELTNYRTLIEPMLHKLLGKDIVLVLPSLPPVYGACVKCIQLCNLNVDEKLFDDNFARTFLHQS